MRRPSRTCLRIKLKAPSQATGATSRYVLRTGGCSRYHQNLLFDATLVVLLPGASSTLPPQSRRHKRAFTGAGGLGSAGGLAIRPHAILKHPFSSTDTCTSTGVHRLYGGWLISDGIPHCCIRPMQNPVWYASWRAQFNIRILCSCMYPAGARM